LSGSDNFSPRMPCQMVLRWYVRWHGNRGFWLASLVPPYQLEWHSNDWSCLLGRWEGGEIPF
jgi:hypothetical protein